MAMLWSDVLADLRSSRRHFGAAVELYDEARAAAAFDYKTAMAFQHAMLAGYTSFEAVLKRLLAMLDELLPVGPDPHAVLLRRIGEAVPGERPAILGVALLRQAGRVAPFPPRDAACL